jgi:hypothetical protein
MKKKCRPSGSGEDMISMISEMAGVKAHVSKGSDKLLNKKMCIPSGSGEEGISMISGTAHVRKTPHSAGWDNLTVIPGTLYTLVVIHIHLAL